MDKNVEVIDRYTIQLCKDNPDKLFIFGDNLIKQGCGGQAIIRNCSNTFGISTKRLPSMTEDSFFSDQFDEYEAVKQAIENLLIHIFCSERKITYVFPSAGLGTGLAQMNIRSPKLFKYMNEQLNKHFGVDYEYG